MPSPKAKRQSRPNPAEAATTRRGGFAAGRACLLQVEREQAFADGMADEGCRPAGGGERGGLEGAVGAVKP